VIILFVQFLAGVTRRVPVVEQTLFDRSDHLSSL
jgi:hypothetical protein